MAAKTKGQDEKHYLYFLYNYASAFMESLQRLRLKVDEFMARILLVLSPVLNVFKAFYTAILKAYSSVTNGLKSVVHCIQAVMNFEYRVFLASLLDRPKTYYALMKDELRKKLWIPAAKQVDRLKRQAMEQLQELRIYARGFRELCRRLFLLLSDLVPGGQLTVGISLSLLSVFLIFELVYYSKLVFRLLNFFMSVLLFILKPVILTLQDVWSVLYSILAVLGTILQNILLAALKVFGFVLKCILKATGTLLSVLYNSFLWFMRLKYVQLVWKTLLQLTGKTLEVFFLKIVPFITLLLIDLTGFVGRISLYIHEKFATVTITQETESLEDLLSFTRMFTVFLVLYCVIWAFRWRKRFPNVRCSEIDDVIPPELASTDDVKSRRGLSRDRKSKASAERGTEKTGKEDEINIQYSSRAHICPTFIRGTCSRGKRCDNHHCPLPYHWQYRAPLEGWKSFSAHDNDVLERWYCDVSNAIVTTRDITPDLSSSASFIRRADHRLEDSSVRLEFEEMRMEINRYRTDIRRLSTVSYVKGSGHEPLSTPWTWYLQEEDGQWSEYGKEGIPNPERIEAAFCRRDSSYNFKTAAGDNFRVYFFMKPMYERNMSPRQAGQRKTVRRRPLYRSEAELEKLK